MDFTESIVEIFALQKARLLASGVPQSQLDLADAQLEIEGLDPESIDKKCCAELLQLLNKRYDTMEPMSTRLNKYGWSTANIKNHMETYLRNLIRKAQSIVRSYCELSGLRAQVDLNGPNGPVGPQGHLHGHLQGHQTMHYDLNDLSMN